MNAEQQLIKDLHEQLLLWIKKAIKKDKWNYYAETTKTLKRAENYLEERGIAPEGKAR